MNDEILAELKKLNKQMGELLCFQKLAAMRYAEKYGDTAVGSVAGSVLEGKDCLPDTPVLDYGANGLSG
jgi:hypothetical protein